MRRVVWSDEAAEQLDQISAYIDVFNPSAAAKMADRLEALATSLVTASERGRPAPDGTRELVTVIPYILQYEVNGDVVNILRVRHSARRRQD